MPIFFLPYVETDSHIKEVLYPAEEAQKLAQAPHLALAKRSASTHAEHHAEVVYVVVDEVLLWTLAGQLGRSKKLQKSC